MKKIISSLLPLFFLPLFVLSQPAYVFHEKGVKLFNDGKYVEAIAQFDIAIKTDATFFEAYCDRGRANLKLGKNDLALADFTKTTELNKSYAPGFFYKAGMEAQSGNDQLAIADYTTAIKLNPDFSESYTNRAMLYVKTNQMALALTDFNKSISIDPKNAEVFYQRGIANRDLNKPADALADFTKASALDPAMGKSHFETGKIQVTQKRNDLAVGEFTKAITLNFSGKEIYKARALAYAALGQDNEAIKDMSIVIDQYHSLEAEDVKMRGDLFAKLKNYPAALKDYNKALILKKDDVPTLLARADLNYAQGKTKFPQAEMDYKKILSLEPANARAAKNLGKMYFDQEKWQLAIDNLSIAIKTNPDGEAYDLRGKANFKLNNKKAACEDLSKAEQLAFPDAAKDKMSAGCK
jgi:tetratricopeptide (TPR) repeat protein